MSTEDCKQFKRVPAEADNMVLVPAREVMIEVRLLQNHQQEVLNERSMVFSDTQ